MESSCVSLGPGSHQSYVDSSHLVIPPPPRGRHSAHRVEVSVPVDDKKESSAYWLGLA